jgi:ribosomal protein S18 acetylase RimI-like enzyme
LTAGPLITVRRAGPGDASMLAGMRYDFRSELAAAAEPREPFLNRTTRWLADRLERGTWTGWIARAGTRPVGMVLAQLVEKMPNPVREPERLGYLSSLYVHPQSRDQGAGGLLLATAVEFCRRSEVESVVLWPSPRSIPLYQRHGFCHRGKVMELRWAIQSSPELSQSAEPLSPRPANPLDSLCR